MQFWQLCARSSAAHLLLCERGHQLHTIMFHGTIQKHSTAVTKAALCGIDRRSWTWLDFWASPDQGESDYFSEAKDTVVLFEGGWGGGGGDTVIAWVGPSTIKSRFYNKVK